jgi:DNA-directed RNA polymerase sigma subunit (sigma70/sigma32)
MGRALDLRQCAIEVPQTLDDLAQELGVLRERVRQIAAAILSKAQNGIKIAAHPRDGMERDPAAMGSI